MIGPDNATCAGVVRPIGPNGVHPPENNWPSRTVTNTLAGGYQVLTAGLRRAEGARDAGQPWGEELVRRYHAELERYAAAHGYRP